MPFKSEKQRRYLHANHPEIAKRWEKEYSHGGILDIDGSEEITTEEGNDISLVDESETGVSTLFRAKHGGSYAMQGGVKNYLGDQETVSGVPIKWQSGPDKPETELAYITKAEKDLILKKDLHGSLKDGPNTGPAGLMSLDSQGDRGTYGDTGQSYGDRQTTDTSAEVGDRQSKADIAEYEKNRAIREHNQKAADDAAKASKDLSFEDQWGKWNDKYDKLNQYSFTGAGVKKRATLTTQNYNEDRAELEKKFGKNLIQKIALGFLGVPVSIGFSDIKAVKSMYDLEKQYKADMQSLKDISVDQGWADFHHAVDTPMQTIDQLLSDTITVNKDEDTEPDGPLAPVVKPVTQEIEDSYAMAGNWLQSYRDLKAKQALSASLQEKWADEREWQQNTLFANSGGLANLFRVKN